MPYGPKPRLVLFHLNAEALRTASPVIEVEDSLGAFVKRIGLDGNGRDFRTIKEQLCRLSASDFRLGMMHEGQPTTIKAQIIDGFQLWTPTDPRQRTLWPSTVSFSSRYFDSLIAHAVPLNETAAALLSHSAMALDVYTWLAQRLHRVPRTKPAFVPWTAVKDQFGQGFGRMDNFKGKFRDVLASVHQVYKEARIDHDGRGLTLRNSPPPVPYRFLPLK